MNLPSEFAVIEEILARCCANSETPDLALLVPNGDDAAIFKFCDSSSSSPVVISVDSIVENRHFRSDYFSPKQIGMRAVEGGFSDIIAMGAFPRFALVNLSLSREISSSQILEVMEGVDTALKRIDARLIGGNTVGGSSELQVTVTAIGELCDKAKILTRSAARPGELIYISGTTGRSKAGMIALQDGLTGFESLKQKHLNPTCRLDLLPQLLENATSAIDISDGLSSDLQHLCKASSCGAIIETELLPIDSQVKELALALERDPLEMALHGGEDFEILFTVPAEFSGKAPGIKIGTITESKEILLKQKGELFALPAGGFDHLKS